MAEESLKSKIPQWGTEYSKSNGQVAEILMEIAIAHRIECKAGLIWIPPIGKPYWIEQPNAGRELTDDEIREYINRDIKNE